MNCQDIELMCRFLHKKLNEQELEQVERHLPNCQECRNFLVFILLHWDKIIHEVDMMLDEEE